MSLNCPFKTKQPFDTLHHNRVRMQQYTAPGDICFTYSEDYYLCTVVTGKPEQVVDDVIVPPIHKSAIFLYEAENLTNISSLP